MSGNHDHGCVGLRSGVGGRKMPAAKRRDVDVTGVPGAFLEPFGEDFWLRPPGRV